MPVPLVVDMDGSFILVETQDVMVEALAHRPLGRLRAQVTRRLYGKAAFKRELIRQTHLSATSLPRRWDFVEWLEGQAARGRRLVLASGSPLSLVAAVAAGHPGLFDDVLATEGRVNLTGRTKAAVLASRYGGAGFDYAGNSWADIPVWSVARRGIICGDEAGVAEAAASVTEIEARFG